jgi:hypothetical protein
MFTGFDRAGQVILNAGFFVSVLCLGHTVYHLDSGADFLERHKPIKCLDLMFGGDRVPLCDGLSTSWEFLDSSMLCIVFVFAATRATLLQSRTA